MHAVQTDSHADSVESAEGFSVLAVDLLGLCEICMDEQISKSTERDSKSVEGVGPSIGLSWKDLTVQTYFTTDPLRVPSFLHIHV